MALDNAEDTAVVETRSVIVTAGVPDAEVAPLAGLEGEPPAAAAAADFSLAILSFSALLASASALVGRFRGAAGLGFFVSAPSLTLLVTAFFSSSFLSLSSGLSLIGFAVADGFVVVPFVGRDRFLAVVLPSALQIELV